MNTVKLFLNNKSQSLRFPKALEFGAEVSEVTVVAVGTSTIDVLGRQYQNARPGPCCTVLPLATATIYSVGSALK